MPPRRKSKKQKDKIKHVSSDEESGSEEEATKQTQAETKEEQKPDADAAAAASAEAPKEAETAPVVEAGPTLVRRSIKQVMYCPVCTFPGEFCEYSGQLEECKPWLSEHYMPTVQQQKEAAAAASGEASGAAAEGGAASAASVAVDDMQEKGKKKKKALPEGVTIRPGGKIVKKDDSIVISLSSRAKRKSMTTVMGLDNWGVKLSDAAKEMKKVFASGATVAQNVALQREVIDIQGEFVDGVVELILKKYPNIPREAFYTIDEKKQRVPYCFDNDDSDDSDSD